jgi:hypothetical protein
MRADNVLAALGYTRRLPGYAQGPLYLLGTQDVSDLGNPVRVIGGNGRRKAIRNHPGT